jgi:hypothetical protein
MREGRNTAKDSPAGVSVPWIVIEVTPLRGHLLHVRFIDGTAGEVDLRPMIFGANPGVFEPLQDESQFRAVYIDAGVVTWPGELDLAPDAMYDEIRAHGRWVVEPFR